LYSESQVCESYVLEGAVAAVASFSVSDVDEFATGVGVVVDADDDDDGEYVASTSTRRNNIAS
jgi:hypothetical protein